MSLGTLTTLSQFIAAQERRYPEATGEFSNILFDVALAAKMISREVNRAGLIGVLGKADTSNVQGEVQQKLDIIANDLLIEAVNKTGQLCGMASEENDEMIPIPKEYPRGRYVMMFDPLDGSSNIDANVSIGTIFSIHRKISDGSRGVEADCLQTGNKQVAAGYVIYGSSTMFVYTTGQGVHGFTLDPSIGEFILSHPDITTPEVGKIYSINESNYRYWDQPVRELIDGYKGLNDITTPKNGRYIGSLVADFHRNLLYGGIFLYPRDTRDPGKSSGKLRLLYEASPMAFICEQAGGYASDGSQSILDIEPTEIHQRVPLIIGSRKDVQEAERIISASLAST